ncbi:MAG: MBL fold metallo-hydrolase [Chitinophagaceae bacterium]|nr:MBL fold metallo-hydrolase [Chitinophagaceae bacterium]
MKIIPLSEGAFTVDKTKSFVPFNIGSDQLSDRPVGSLLVEVQPFLVITDQDVLLLDTGLGFVNDDGLMQLHQLIMDAGINPSEVTKVLMSHLHKDHSGGIGLKNREGSVGALAFPNADYYVQQKEFELAMSGEGSYKKEDIACLQGSEKLKLIDGNGSISGYIHYEVTAGHSPYHQVFWIAAGDKKIFFGGDDAPQLSQMRKRYIAKYDYDGRKCMELRQQWWETGQQEGWSFLFYHDIKMPVYPPSGNSNQR